MKVNAIGKTHAGMKRKLNEDSYLISPEMGLYIIADGMGGHKAGEIASRMVIEVMTDYWKKVLAGNHPLFIKKFDKDISEKAKHLENSIFFTNIIVHEAQKKIQFHKMGSTISALMVEDDCIWVANVGDSPVYIFYKGKLILVSEEHSVEAEQKNRGMIANPAAKNILTRVIGSEEYVKIFTTCLRPEFGDIILLCSDGLVNYLSEQAISTILNDFSLTLDKKVDVLIDEANKGGGGDNITVILLQVGKEGTLSRLKKRFGSFLA